MGAANNQHSNSTGPLARLWQLIAAEKKEIVAIYFYAILSGLVQLSVPVGIQAIIGFILGASMVASIFLLIALVVVGVLLVGVFQINVMRIIEKIQQRLFVQYSFAFAEAIPQVDLKQVDKYYLPEKTNRFFDTVNVQKGLSKILLDLPVAIIQIVFGLILMSLYHPVFIAFGAFLIVILWLIARYNSRAALDTSLSESAHKYAVASWLEEMARVIKSFKFSHGTHLNLYKADKHVLDYLQARTQHFNILLFKYKMLVGFKVAITAAMLTIGTYLLLNQQLNIGEFIAAEIVILMVTGAVEKIIVSLESVYDTLTGLEKLANVTEMPKEKSGTLAIQENVGGMQVELNDLTFSYISGQPMLKQLTFSIPSNNIVCISGTAGSGKSTLLKVLSGSFSDFEGSLLLNKVPIGNYQLESLRKKTGIYLNNEDLFTSTVWDNISMGRSAISMEQIGEMADELGLGDFLSSLPNGFSTVIDPVGQKLPATIVKKLLLLRAFVHRPFLLLLENPCVGLDETAAQNVRNYLLNKRKNATAFIVSNDADFAAQCDYHLHLKNGSIESFKRN